MNSAKQLVSAREASCFFEKVTFGRASVFPLKLFVIQKISLPTGVGS